MNSRNGQKGWSLLGVLAVVAVVVVVVVVARQVTRPSPTQAQVNALAAGIAPVATIGTAYSSNIFNLPGSTLATMSGNASWLTYSAGTLSGTPDGNDFGAFSVTFTLVDPNGQSVSATGTITVAPPTMTVTPPGGFVVPFHATDSVSMTLAPAPVTSYDNITYSHNILSGTARTRAVGPASTDGSGDQVSLTWEYGGDFTGEAWVKIPSSVPGGAEARLGPIPSKSQ